MKSPKMTPDPAELAKWQADVRRRCAERYIDGNRKVLLLVAAGDHDAALAVARATNVEVNLILAEPPPWVRPHPNAITIPITQGET